MMDSQKKEEVTLFLCGDVMTGRGIDQILPFPSEPTIHESYLKLATDYIEIAEAKNGEIPRQVSWEYIWGDALAELERRKPEARIVNLETSITTSEEWCEKGINYRMNPKNVPCLLAAHIDVCALANNHVLDWGERGLFETIESLKKAGIGTAGAGQNRHEAEMPAIVSSAGRRVLVFSYATESSGVPPSWAATETHFGVNHLSDFSEVSFRRIGELISQHKRPGDIVVFSIHWGGNWGYEIPAAHRQFARALIDHAQVDLVHGHSSHHAKAIEVHEGKFILYGCGDFITDYEGIGGYENYHGDISLMYFPRLSARTGKLLSCEIVPLKMNRFQLKSVDAEDLRRIQKILNREGKWGRISVAASDTHLSLSW